MDQSLLLFVIYVFLAVYCCGSMTVLQIQHFALYPLIGKDSFKEYLKANNKAAVIPAILPAILLFIMTIILLFSRPVFMSINIVIISLAMNVVNIASTAIWQGRLHAQLAKEGYNEALAKTLIHTNWIRTIALLVQAVIAVYCVWEVLNKAT